MGHGDVDAPVGDDPLGHRDRPATLELAGQQLAADGVAQVVGQQRGLGQAHVGRVRGHHVGFEVQAVREVRLGRQAVAQEVEEVHPPAGRQRTDHPAEVERRGREPVEDEQGLSALGPVGRHLDGEDPVPGQVPVLAPGLPVGHRGVLPAPGQLRSRPAWPRPARGRPSSRPPPRSR